MRLNRDILIHCEKAIHLGNYIATDENIDIKTKVNNAANDLVYRTNVLLSRFGHCTTDVKCSLFDAYCTSYYGSPLWKLDKLALAPFCTTWRKCIRRVMNLDCRTRSRYLPLLIKKTDIRIQLLSRFCSFWIKCYTSFNSVVGFCAKLSLQSLSVAAHNIKEVLSYMSWNRERLLCHVTHGKCVQQLLNKLHFRKCSTEDICTTNVINELSMQRDKLVDSPLTHQEVNELLQFLCTN